LLKEECEVNTKIALIISRNVCFGSWQVMSKKNAQAATCSNVFSGMLLSARDILIRKMSPAVCLK
jgi:hypothetical protein